MLQRSAIAYLQDSLASRRSWTDGNGPTMTNVTKTELPPLDEYVAYLKRIWASNWITNDGQLLQRLEHRLQTYLRVKHLVAVANGTLALHCALKVLRCKGEVITTPFTFAATTNAVLWEHLTPVFVDIDPETFNIDPHEVERHITDRTSAILAVHVYGNPCYTEILQDIADRHGVHLIYDAAHAFGVEYNNQSLLKSGTLSVLSFHATKVYHTGEGGAIVSNDEQIARELMLLRNHGIKSENEVVVPGTNAKMTELQAAMGLCNLETIEEHIARRKKIYERYKRGLHPLGVRFQKIIASKYNYSYMPVCFESVATRERVRLELQKRGINPRQYFYPLTVDYDYFKHSSKYRAQNKRHLTHARDISNKILCLPLYPSLDMTITDTITDVVNSILDDT